MLRFIVNFFIFGLIFYLIYLYLPEAFATLVHWVEVAWNWVAETFNQLFSRGPSTPPSQP